MFKLVLKLAIRSSKAGHPRFLNPSTFQHITFSATGTGNRVFSYLHTFCNKGDRKRRKKKNYQQK